MKLTKLTSTYKDLITEELLTEDRNQAKSILRKAGITTDGWKLNPEYPNVEKGQFIINFLKELNGVLLKYSVIGDYPKWVNIVLNSFSDDYDNYGELNYKYLCEEIGKMYGYARSVKEDPIPMVENEVGSDDLESIISTVNHRLGYTWVDNYIETYIDEGIIKRLDIGDLRDLKLLLSRVMFDPPVKERLIKLHRKLRKFSPIDNDGNKRNYNDVREIIEYIEDIVNGEFYDDNEYKEIKGQSDLIWEGKGLLVVQIDYTSVDRGEFCHGSEHWCIISSHEEQWDTYGGDSTYVIYSQDHLTPYNRIAVIYRPEGWEYWDDNDTNISRKIGRIIPSYKEIEKTILEKGDLDRHITFRKQEIYDDLEDHVKGGNYIGEEFMHPMLNFPELVEEYWSGYMSNEYNNELYKDEVYEPDQIPDKYKDSYYTVTVSKINDDSLKPNTSLEFLGLPDKYRELIEPLYDRFIRGLLSGDIVGHQVNHFQDYGVATKAGRYILNLIRTNDPIMKTIDTTEEQIYRIFTNGFNLKEEEVYEFFYYSIFTDLVVRGEDNLKTINIDMIPSLGEEYKAKLFTEILRKDFSIINYKYSSDNRSILHYLKYIDKNLDDDEFKHNIKQALTPHLDQVIKKNNGHVTETMQIFLDMLEKF